MAMILAEPQTSWYAFNRGRWTATSFGQWSGVAEVWLSRDKGATHEVIRAYRSDYDRNFFTSGDVDERGTVWLCVAARGHLTDAKFSLEAVTSA